jgi:hypothetical protein
MAGASKEAWNEVGDRFGEVGKRLKDRYHSLGESQGAEAEERRIKVEEALRAARDQLDRAFTSLGDTMRDPGTKDSLGKAVTSLGDALSATFAEAGDEIRKRFGRRDAGEGGGASGADQGPAPQA